MYKDSNDDSNQAFTMEGGVIKVLKVIFLTMVYNDPMIRMGFRAFFSSTNKLEEVPI
jgi:hypothetical protein